jgi:hypothetical protein
MKTLCSLFVIVLAAVTVTACKKPPPPEQPARIVPRNDFAPEEFGIGRAHTKNFACNREIDGYLEEIRRCYNTHNMEACEGLQRQRTDKINRLKNAAHCAHGNAQR